MARYYSFEREDVFPSFFPNRLQDFLAAARCDLRITAATATKIAIVPDAAMGVAAISVDGRWRFIEATVERAHPGGAKGTYSIWAVALDNDIDNEPDPFTDHTDYSFDLRITDGSNPSGAGVEIFQKIGEIDWSGAVIEAIRQTYGSIIGAQIADAALVDGDLTWTRNASGARLASITPKAVAAPEIDDSLKPSAGAADATEALRALGVDASTAAAGNDSRLSDERTPKAESVTAAKVHKSLKPSGEAAAGTEALRALGSAAGTAAAGDDTRLLPTGAVVMTSLAAASPGYIIANGENKLRATYPNLHAKYAAEGYPYGAGDGATTFGIPDYRGRVLVGLGTHADVNALTDSDGLAVGNRTPKHAHVGPNHVHTTPNHVHRVNLVSGVENDRDVHQEGGGGFYEVAAPFHVHSVVGDTDAAGAGNTGAAGAAATSTETPAYATINFMIKT